MEKKLTIGVMIGNANSPHTKSFMRGVYGAAEEMNINVIFFLGVHMTSYFREYLGAGTENRYDYQYNVVYDYAHLSDVDGLIISYGSLGIFLEDKIKENFINKFNTIPYVLVEEYDESHMGSSIIADNYRGMYQIVEHLIHVHRCRKLCFVAGPDSNTDAGEREQAFRDALSAQGIDFCEDMLAKGDYSQACGKQIGELLDRHPDADALVCANDVMAETAYHECAKRNLVVGKDIAITGYDDWEIAESMLPPLTTVLQNAIDMGYESITKIAALCNGEPPVEIRTPAIVKIRASCGCNTMTEYHFRKDVSIGEFSNDDYIESVVEQFCGKVLHSQVSSDIRKNIMEQMVCILKKCTYIYDSSKTSLFSRETLMNSVNELLTGRYGSYISATALVDGINEYIKHLFFLKKDDKKMKIASEIAGLLLQYIQSCVITQSNMREAQYEQDTMFIPLISRDMISYIDNEKSFYEAPMFILNVLRVKSAYLYLFEEPYRHKYGEKWECPECLFLVSYLEDGKSAAFAGNDRPIISADKGMVTNFINDRKRVMTALNLFLGEEQYGVLLVEIEPQDMLLMHLVSMQISSALNFFYLYRQQKRMQERLEVLVDEVNEKNNILSFISVNDELTGVLNRRGFMEKAMQLVHSSEKKDAILFIADLDHLKEINDNFGHIAGDYAIKTAVGILQKSLGREALVARIGGDEFVAVLLDDEHTDGEAYLRRIKEVSNNVNSESEKEYYVEVSVGYTVFECNSSVDFTKILSESDKMLYCAKQSRRTSVKKHN